ncbi:hypothetical protein SH2C18_15020 [Clostridium sediminicola]|uniref:peptidoglycan-binding domain-containing protein n=1 Tax=Clostridium sediminicola TaxID=3114879 RepID=UPI0031F26143
MDVIDSNLVFMSNMSYGNKPDKIILHHAAKGYLIKKNSSKYDRVVVKIQQMLTKLGYDVGECGVDGYFGEDTEKAIREFQREGGIMVDGLVGEVSWGKLFG